MVDWSVIKRLGVCFPGWFINDQGEFIAHQKANVYFNISTCESVEDMREIYTYIGNACDHQKTIRFIQSGYDMVVLEGKG